MDFNQIRSPFASAANPGFDLPPIDRLEAFNPNGRCVYKRVLVAVETENQIHSVWLYAMQPAEKTVLKMIFSAWNGEKIIGM